MPDQQIIEPPPHQSADPLPARTSPSTALAMQYAGARGAVGSQATIVEQTRAIAEIKATILSAQECPRSVTGALAALRESCMVYEFAERAFWAFKRGGQTIEGETIHLARETARCWGNIKYGIRELSRDDVAGHSEMLAYAWDVQTNTRAETTFIVPHTRDKDGKQVPLSQARDIYENNANMGSRRLREQIFAVIPVYVREAAVAECLETLQSKDRTKPMPQRRADAVARFEKLGVSQARMERHHGKADEWTESHLASLHVLFKSLQRREITIDEAFPEEEGVNTSPGPAAKILGAANGERQTPAAPPERQAKTETAKTEQAKTKQAKAEQAKSDGAKADGAKTKDQPAQTATAGTEQQQGEQGGKTADLPFDPPTGEQQPKPQQAAKRPGDDI